MGPRAGDPKVDWKETLMNNLGQVARSRLEHDRLAIGVLAQSTDK